MAVYLRMGDCFDGDEAWVEQRLFSGCICKEEATYAAHAVAFHDELVAVRDELLATIESWYEHEYGNGIGPTHDEVKALIAKAKGE